MKAVVAAFNQEKALVGAFSVITNLRICFGRNFLKHYCRSEPFPYLGQQAYSRSGCRNTVMQMIAEKSVNCSLMSLPPSPGSDLPTCGPLEGLALMYILKVGCRAAMDYKGQICTSGTRRPRGPKSFNQE